jgi:hypothetical protein
MWKPGRRSRWNIALEGWYKLRKRKQKLKKKPKRYY